MSDDPSLDMFLKGEENDLREMDSYFPDEPQSAATAPEPEQVPEDRSAPETPEAPPEAPEPDAGTEPLQTPEESGQEPEPSEVDPLTTIPWKYLDEEGSLDLTKDEDRARSVELVQKGLDRDRIAEDRETWKQRYEALERRLEDERNQLVQAGILQPVVGGGYQIAPKTEPTPPTAPVPETRELEGKIAELEQKVESGVADTRDYASLVTLNRELAVQQAEARISRFEQQTREATSRQTETQRILGLVDHAIKTEEEFKVLPEDQRQALYTDAARFIQSTPDMAQGFELARGHLVSAATRLRVVREAAAADVQSRLKKSRPKPPPVPGSLDGGAPTARSGAKPLEMPQSGDIEKWNDYIDQSLSRLGNT